MASDEVRARGATPMLSQERREELRAMHAAVFRQEAKPFTAYCAMADVNEEAGLLFCSMLTTFPELLDAYDRLVAVERERDKAVADFNDCFKAARAWAELVNCIEAISELDKFDEMTSDQQKLDAYIQSWSRMKERAEFAERERDALREQLKSVAEADWNVSNGEAHRILRNVVLGARAALREKLKGEETNG